MTTWLGSLEASAMLAGKPLCTTCVAVDAGQQAARTPAPVNALVVDPDDVVHAGDAIGGWTSCGKDGNRWRWIVPTRPGNDQLEEPDVS